MFGPDTRAQIIACFNSLLDEHGTRITAAIDDAADHKMPVTFVLDIDCSESAPQVDLKIRFTPETVTDVRSVVCKDPSQHEFTIMTPSQLAAARDEEKAAKKAAKEKGDESGDGTLESATAAAHAEMVASNNQPEMHEPAKKVAAKKTKKAKAK